MMAHVRTVTRNVPKDVLREDLVTYVVYRVVPSVLLLANAMLARWSVQLHGRYLE